MSGGSDWLFARWWAASPCRRRLPAQGPRDARRSELEAPHGQIIVAAVGGEPCRQAARWVRCQRSASRNASHVCICGEVARHPANTSGVAWTRWRPLNVRRLVDSYADIRSRMGWRLPVSVLSRQTARATSAPMKATSSPQARASAASGRGERSAPRPPRRRRAPDRRDVRACRRCERPGPDPRSVVDESSPQSSSAGVARPHSGSASTNGTLPR